MPEKHHRYGGSTATRSLNCGAWTTLSEDMPRGKVSLAAAQGTVGHSMFEEGMNDADYDPKSMLGLTVVIDGRGVTVTDEMVNKVYTAYEVMNDVLEDIDPDDDDIEEYEVGHEYSDIIGGTGDIVVANKVENVFAVGDLKTGDGTMVFAEDNDQLLFYAWMMVLKYKDQFDFNEDTDFVLFIIQPSERRENPYDDWVVGLKEITDFAESFKLAVRVAESGQSDPAAGEWCKYCPAEVTCPAKTGLVAKSQRLKYDSDNLIDLLKALGMVGDVEDWCRAVRKLAHEQAENGVKLEGFKLVAKRATRQWNDAEAVEQKCKNARKIVSEDYYTQTLKSPAQLEKACKAKGVDFKKYGEYISLLSSGTTLVKESDKRSEVLPLQALADLSASIKK